MFTLKKLVLAFTLSVASVLHVSAAETFIVDGLKYTVNNATIHTVSVFGLDDASIYDLNIPRTVTYNNITYEVSEVNALAFQNCNITSVTIPRTVIRVNKKAFDGCTSLTKVTLEDGYASIYMSNIYSYDGDSDHAEGKGMFYSCPLKDVYIGRNLTYPADNSDGYSPFACKNIEKAVIGPTVTTLYRNLFWDCMALKEITFAPGSTLTTIEDEALSNCGLESLSLPDATTEIRGAFRQCKSLTRIHFGKSLKTIPLDFFRFNSLKEIDVDPANSTYYSENGILYSKDKKTLLRMPLAVTEASILPVETVASHAFRDCSELQTINFPSSVKTIKQYAVTGCTKITTIVVPESVKTIEEGALGAYYYAMSERWYNDGSDLYTHNSTQGYVISKSKTAPTADPLAFHGRESWTLWVPQGCKDSYSTAEGWKSFAQVIEGPCHINVGCNIATAGDVSGEGDYQPGEEVKLSVTSKGTDKYKFIGWFEGDTNLSTDPEYNFTLLRPMAKIIAKFEPIPDAAKDDISIAIINGHLIIDIKHIENATTYITEILNEKGETVAVVKTEITTPETSARAARKVTEILNPFENYTYHTRIYDSASTLLAHFTGNFSGSETSVEDIISDDATEVVYYNLQGVRVDKPANGFYIVRRGNTISKEYIR